MLPVEEEKKEESVLTKLGSMFGFGKKEEVKKEEVKK